MSSNLPGGGGVRSLRAMFESSHPERSASPEAARGRSPTPGSPSVRSSESNSRPTSKVRASFISVGPFDSPPTSMPGENGVESPAVESPAVESLPGSASPFSSPPAGAINALRAAAPSESTGSTATQRRGSMSLDPARDSDALEELRHTVSSEADHRRASVDIQETVPENAVFTGPTNTPFMEIKEDNAMGTFVDNDNNKWQDAKKASEPGPRAEATNENARHFLEEAAAGLKRVEIAAEEKKSESAHKSSSASDATATGATPTPTPAAAAPPPAEEPKKEEIALPAEEPTMGQPDKKTDVEDESAEMKPSDPKEESAVSGGEALPPPTETLKPLGVEKTTEEAPAPAPAAEEKAEEKVEPQPEEKADAAPEPAPEAEKTLAPAEESKPSGAKSPVPPGTPTSPVASPKSTTSKTSSAKEPAKRTSRTSLKSATSSSAAKPRATSRPAAEKKGTHATPPFTKPRPKSPTRPAKLPSHLTAPTAASAAKREAEKAEEKKAAAKPKTTTPRAPAVASKTTTAAAHKTAAEKKAGSRPAQTTAKRPESRTSRPSVGARAPDDSFLARMMRPTAASASKTHEKKDDVKSPPRRQTSVKTKQANGSGVGAKAKTKVVEGIDKAKEKVLDKDTSEKKEESSGPSLEPALPITEKPVEEEKVAEEEGKNTPPQDAETPEQSGETMTQTPAGIEGGVIRPTTLATLVEEAPPQIRSPPQQLFPDAATTSTPTSGSRALRSFSNASSMTAYSSASTAFTTSTAATSVYGGARCSTPTSSYTSGTSTPSSVSVCGGDIPPLPSSVKPNVAAAAAAPRRGRISNLVAFFEKNQ
ncbi:mucin-7 precursor [Diplodia corticola]|uniref:Mucin-7 n=1 Tax=Diplodia corticola TaxID=236234 RepID=A0A1J9R8J8_9PEZI|nr:mucin-7 precursor [Diplodia corticola]OJD36849.1 mucin-7 precursor [Diplodia corticola]